MPGGMWPLHFVFVGEVADELLFEPRSTIFIEDFEGRQAHLLAAEPVSRKVQRVLRKLDFPLISGEEVRGRLVNTRIEGHVFPVRLLGETLVLPKFAEEVLLDNVYVAGSAPAHMVRNFALYDFTILTIVCLSVGGFIGFFERGILNPDKSVRRRIPELHSFKGMEPFEEGDPFFELSTDFPELLQAGREGVLHEPRAGDPPVAGALLHLIGQHPVERELVSAGDIAVIDVDFLSFFDLDLPSAVFDDRVHGRSRSSAAW